MKAQGLSKCHFHARENAQAKQAMPKMTYMGLRAALIKRRRKHEKWREIGLDYPGVPLGTLCRIVKDETYTPKSAILRARLGLAPIPVEVSPCAKCGQLHAFQRRCPGSPLKYAPHPVMHLSKVRRVLQDRALTSSAG